MVPPHSLLNPHSLITTHFVTVLLLTIASFASGAVVDTTIDDTDSSFSWSDGWTAVGPSGCGSCATKPDVTKMQGQTYHDRSIVLSKGETAGGSFTFTGSAVRIYGIDEPSGSSNLVFTFNGQSTTYSGSGTDKFLYNALFFSASGLAADQAHTVNWALVGNPAINVDQQLAMFDYAVVTSGTPDTTSTGGSTTGGSTSSGSNSGDSSGSNTNTDNSGSTSGSNSGANSGSNNASSSGGSGSSEVSGSPTGKTSTSGSSTATSNGTPGTPSGSAGAQSSGVPQPSSSSNTTGSSTNSNSSPNSNDPQSASSSAPKSKSNTPIGAIVGAVLAILIILAVLAALAMCLRRRRRNRSEAAFASNQASEVAAPPRATRVRGNYVVPEPFVGTAAAASESASASAPSEAWLSEKSDIGYTNAAANNNPNANADSRASLLASLPPPAPAQAQSVGDVEGNVEAQPPPPTARERLLEQRLAELEARIGGEEPPAYLPRSSSVHT